MHDSTKNAPVEGLLLIDKPAGMTSFDVVRRVRRVAKTSRVGHTGTLDPEATGLLPVVVGRCTRLASFLSLDQKTYEFDICLGAATDTDDAWGEVVQTEAWEHVVPEALEQALQAFRGTIMQVPPIYSALKVDGVRAYDLARKGLAVELAAREVTVLALELCSVDLPRASLRMQCSSGTYVRALVRDLGRALGTVAHTTRIRRTAVGPFDLSQAPPLDALTAENVAGYAMSPVQMLASLARLDATADEVRETSFGKALRVSAQRLGRAVLAGDPVALVGEAHELLAVSEVEEVVGEGGESVVLRPRKVFIGV